MWYCNIFKGRASQYLSSFNTKSDIEMAAAFLLLIITGVFASVSVCVSDEHTRHSDLRPSRRETRMEGGREGSTDGGRLKTEKHHTIKHKVKRGEWMERDLREAKGKRQTCCLQRVHGGKVRWSNDAGTETKGSE